MYVPKLMLHHYTSGTGLIGILDAGEVWASSIHSLNDSKEFSHAIELGRVAIREVLGGTGVEGDEKFFHSISQQLDSISRIALYVACFSTVGDSLSQWRGYCPPGFGYSIGFDGDVLEKVAKLQGFKLKQCVYDSFEQKRITKEWAVRNVGRMLPGLRMNSECADEYVRNTSGALIDEFMEFAPFLKHSAFKDEREWRLISLVSSSDSRLKVRAAKSMLIRYLPVDLNLNPESTILWNIRVGPTPHPELALDAITHYFTRAFIKGGVLPSQIPYRDW